MFGKGISTTGDILDLAAECKVVQKSGAWYAYNTGEKIGQGRDNTKLWLEQNPEVLAEIEAKVRESFGYEDGSESKPKEASEAEKPAKKSAKKASDTEGDVEIIE